MVFALASTWALILAFGCSACIGPVWYTVNMAYQNAFDPGSSYGGQASGLEFLFMVNSFFLIALGLVIGYPVASASGKILLLVFSSWKVLIFKLILQAIAQIK